MSKTDEPEKLECFYCRGPMEKHNRIETLQFVRVLWHCTKCNANYWKKYTDEQGSRRKRNRRWH